MGFQSIPTDQKYMGSYSGCIRSARRKFADGTIDRLDPLHGFFDPVPPKQVDDLSEPGFHFAASSRAQCRLRNTVTDKFQHIRSPTEASTPSLLHATLLFLIRFSEHSVMPYHMSRLSESQASLYHTMGDKAENWAPCIACENSIMHYSEGYLSYTGSVFKADLLFGPGEES